MSGTFTNLGVHFVFSTKERFPLIDETIREPLHEYIGGIIRKMHGILIEVNSRPDHVHLYTCIPKMVSISKLMETVKSNSSKWIHRNFSHKSYFAWQEGYGAFAVSKSNEHRVIDYIREQEEHHRKKSFQEEFVEFLVMNGINYDEKYIWK